MRRTFGLWPLVLILAGLLSGCTRQGKAAEGGEAAGPEPEQERAGELYWTESSGPEGERITDRLGNSIPLGRYRRIVVLSAGAVETLYLIGAQEAILAIPQYREPVWPEEQTVLLPTVGSQARPNREVIVSLEPDLIIGNTMTGSVVEEFSRRRYPAIVHGAYNMEDIFNSALLMGRLTGREEESQSLVAEKRAKLAAIRAELGEQPLRLKGAFLYAANPIMAFSGATLAGEILRILGTTNIAEDLDAAQPILSPEYLLASNPDFLFGALSLTDPAEVLAADPAIPQTRAGRKMHIRIVPSALFLRSSPRMVENLLELFEEVKSFSSEE
ncbi:MAG: ABC transporter substrate-binding protein [Spirochaetaceae bacterium]|jgi:iron complex transport system substrate-binding protein|nr:ABC transporter substrate-binding protein [Spirochaetaceae bacterium]